MHAGFQLLNAVFIATLMFDLQTTISHCNVERLQSP